MQLRILNEVLTKMRTCSSNAVYTMQVMRGRAMRPCNSRGRSSTTTIAPRETQQCLPQRRGTRNYTDRGPWHGRGPLTYDRGPPEPIAARPCNARSERGFWNSHLLLRAGRWQWRWISNNCLHSFHGVDEALAPPQMRIRNLTVRLHCCSCRSALWQFVQQNC